MDSVIILKDGGISPEQEPRRQGPIRETSEIPEEPYPIMRPPKTEVSRHIITAGEVVEGDIVPNPYTDVSAARANVLLAYGAPKALN